MGGNPPIKTDACSTPVGLLMQVVQELTGQDNAFTQILGNLIHNAKTPFQN